MDTAEIKYEKMLSPQELAELLGVPISWIYKQTMMRGPGSIPRYKLGKYLKFRGSQVLPWIQEKKIV